MKEDGGYGLLEVEDLGNLRKVNQELSDAEVLDSRVSTISYKSSAYNGALVVLTGKRITSNELEDIEEKLADEADGVEESSLSLRYEGKGMDNSYYSICNLTQGDI